MFHLGLPVILGRLWDIQFMVVAMLLNNVYFLHFLFVWNDNCHSSRLHTVLNPFQPSFFSFDEHLLFHANNRNHGDYAWWLWFCDNCMHVVAFWFRLTSCAKDAIKFFCVFRSQWKNTWCVKESSFFSLEIHSVHWVTSRCL